jgi:hypothetical protein
LFPSRPRRRGERVSALSPVGAQATVLPARSTSTSRSAIDRHPHRTSTYRYKRPPKKRKAATNRRAFPSVGKHKPEPDAPPPANDDRKPAIVTTTSRHRLKLVRAERAAEQGARGNGVATPWCPIAPASERLGRSVGRRLLYPCGSAASRWPAAMCSRLFATVLESPGAGTASSACRRGAKI